METASQLSVLYQADSDGTGCQIQFHSQMETFSKTSHTYSKHMLTKNGNKCTSSILRRVHSLVQSYLALLFSSNLLSQFCTVKGIYGYPHIDAPGKPHCGLPSSWGPKKQKPASSAHCGAFEDTAGGEHFGKVSTLSSKMLILYAGCLLDGVNLGNGTSSVNGALPSSPHLSPTTEGVSQALYLITTLNGLWLNEQVKDAVESVMNCKMSWPYSQCSHRCNFTFSIAHSFYLGVHNCFFQWVKRVMTSHKKLHYK